MKTVNVKVYNNSKQTKEIQVVTEDGKPTIIKADKHVNYEFFDQSINRAPNHIITKRHGKDLHVSFEREGKADDLIIQDFYDSEDHALIGIAEDGNYYYYIPDTGEVVDYVTQLEANAVEGQALGGEQLTAPWWVMVPKSAGFPWWLTGLVAVPFLVGNNDGDKNAKPTNPTTDNNNLSALTLPDVKSGIKGQPVTQNILGNDQNIGNLNLATLKLIDPVTHQPTNKIIVEGQGVWTQLAV